jgi:hypothetical protein
MDGSKWDQTREYFITYSLLLHAARHRGFVTYQDIVQAASLPSKGNYMSSQLGSLLGAISANEKNQNRPMLSALAIGKSGKPGQGFYTWARDLGFLQSGGDEDAFWETECEKVYVEWDFPSSQPKPGLG